MRNPEWAIDSPERGTRPKSAYTSPPIVVHLVRFPQLTINHALVLFSANETKNEIQFAAYDPNRSDAPVSLKYNRATQTFLFGPNDYFPGGRVDVYEVYHRWDY